MTVLAARGAALAAAALGLLWPPPALACGGACATNSLVALPFLGRRRRSGRPERARRGVRSRPPVRARTGEHLP